ncbi:MAG: hypothetical protein DKT66_02600 [Candidatus Melainabacteria bacterium]|nr:MAG: hypothetical protein DKT66_02600 [Candidatus Melainabacteria bacterium]
MKRVVEQNIRRRYSRERDQGWSIPRAAPVLRTTKRGTDQCLFFFEQKCKGTQDEGFQPLAIILKIHETAPQAVPFFLFLEVRMAQRHSDL